MAWSTDTVTITFQSRARSAHRQELLYVNVAKMPMQRKLSRCVQWRWIGRHCGFGISLAPTDLPFHLPELGFHITWVQRKYVQAVLKRSAGYRASHVQIWSIMWLMMCIRSPRLPRLSKNFRLTKPVDINNKTSLWLDKLVDINNKTQIQ